MMGCLAFFLVLALLVVKVAIMYLLIPYVLVHVLALFGITIGFYLSMGICFLFFFVLMMVKRK